MRIRHRLAGLILALAAVAVPATAAEGGETHVSVSLGRHVVHRPAVHRTYRYGRHVFTRHRHHHHRHVHRHTKKCVWRPGHFAVHKHKVYVPGRYVVETVPARYESHYDTRKHRWIEIQVRPERRRKVWIPGRYEVRKTRHWVRGRWRCVHRH